MNQRMLALIVEAGATSKNLVEITQKLCESIVDECAQIAAATHCPYTDAGEEANHAWDMACVQAAKEIRNHFKE